MARAGDSGSWNPWKWSATELVVVIVVVAAADFGAFIVALTTGLAENCDNGISSWECSEFLRSTSLPAFYALLLLLVVLVAVCLARVVRGALGRRPQ
jgi:hypothetical protein